LVFSCVFFANEGTTQASEVIVSMEEGVAVYHEVGNVTAEPKRRKNVIDMEIQTEEFTNGDKPGIPPDVANESTTQSSLAAKETTSHLLSCTANNCLVCATIGERKDNAISERGNLRGK